MTQFQDLGLAQPILEALTSQGYLEPTPIQAQAIPIILQGSDLLALAQTGTGKTAAFALPILHRLAMNPKAPRPKTVRCLILAPTRELAAQIDASVKRYGSRLKLSSAVIFGGVGHVPQTRALSRGLDILVATPGRLIDHLESGGVRLDALEVLVLDEADHMMDMGFIHALRRIIRALPPRRQNLFFSATMPDEIAALAKDLLQDPIRVAVTPAATPIERIVQHVIDVRADLKGALLVHLLRGETFGRTLIFARTKHGSDRIVRHLEAAGLPAAAIHGNKSQSQRERALAAFKSGAVPFLVATDIAARGIDVQDVTHVINFDLPNIPETYVHRIGRTARAGAEGSAISFMSPDERGHLRAIERLTRLKLPIEPAPHGLTVPRPTAAPSNAGQPQGNRERRYDGPREGRHEGPREGGHGQGQPAQRARHERPKGQRHGGARPNRPQPKAAATR